MNNAFEFDVAFSFLQRDERLAMELADRVRDRVKLFVYSEQQMQLIANDGIDAFSQVFRIEARVAVILYREEWGKTKWTRIEETAIKSRLLDDGFKFLVVVSLDGKHPIWYPNTHIWGDLNRYGIDGLASVIETRVRETGGIVRSGSAVDDAINLQHDIIFEAESSMWRESTDGVLDAQEELATLFAELERLAEKINEETSRESSQLRLAVEFQRRGDKVGSVFCRGLSLQLVWRIKFSNTLRESKLYVKILEASDPMNLVVSRGEPIIVREVEYGVELATDRRVGWRETEGNERFLTSAQLADALLKDLIKLIRFRPADTSYIDYVELG